MQKNNGLDKNQLISFVIFSAILMAFMFYFQNKQSDEKQVADAKAKTEQKVASKTIANNINATVNAAAIKNVTVKNKELTLEFASLGGQLSSVEINQYKAYNAKTDKHDLPLYLIEKNNSSYGFQFKDKTGKTFNTKDLVFVPSVKDNTVTMTAQVSGATIQYVYQLLDNYTLDFNVKTQGLSSIVTDEKADFHWNYTVRGMEKGRSQEQTHSEFNYAFDNYGSTDYDTNGFEEPEETLNWLAVKQQFFASIIESTNGFTHAKGTQETIEKGEFLKKFNFEGQVKLAGNELNQNFKWYFLPLDLPLLKTFEGKEFDSILPLGWSFIGTLNRIFFVPVYNWLSDWGIAAGWVIFLMTIATKLILSPVMFKQHKLSAMMKVVKPEIEEDAEGGKTVIYEVKKGIFKQIAEEAKKIRYQSEELSQQYTFDDAWDDLVSEAYEYLEKEESLILNIQTVGMGLKVVDISEKGNLKVQPKSSKEAKIYTVSFSRAKKLQEKQSDINEDNGNSLFFQQFPGSGQGMGYQHPVPLFLQCCFHFFQFQENMPVHRHSVYPVQ